MLEHSIDVERWNVLEIFRIAIPEDIFDCPKCCIIVIEDGKDVISLQVELFRNFFCPPFVEIVFFIRLGPVFTENIVLTESELEVLVVEAHFVVCQAQVFEVEEEVAEVNKKPEITEVKKQENKKKPHNNKYRKNKNSNNGNKNKTDKPSS